MATQAVDVAVKGGVVITPTDAQPADVLVKDGKIHDVVGRDVPYEARTVIDATRQYVLPGIIDAHQHPVYSDRIDTISREAAVGGTTTVIGFVGALKAWGAGGTLVDAVKAFVEEGNEHSYVDFSAHGSLASEDIETLADQVPKLVDLGVTSYKGFTAYKRRGMKLEDHEFLQAMEVVAANQAVLQVHAENGALVDHLTDKFKAEGNVAPEYWTRASPPLAEAEAVLRIASFAAEVGCPLYLVHLSSREAIDVVRLWRTWDGHRIYTETCPHFLTLTHDVLLERGSLAKVAPPLRNEGHLEALWGALRSGDIDVVGTDFGGHTRDKKQPHFDNIFEPPAGVPGVGNLLEVLHQSGVNTGRVSLQRLVDVLCEKPARIFGMYPRKGVLAPGSDADVVVFDPTLEHTINVESQHVTSDYNLWEGWTCVGYPTVVMQRGRVIAKDGELTGTEPGGQFIARAQHTEFVK